MKLPFLPLAFGFTLGIILAQDSMFSASIISGCFGIGIVVSWLLRGRNLFLPFFILMMACSGFLCCRLDFYKRADAIEHYIGSHRVGLTGVVASLPNVKTRGRRVTVSFVLSSRSAVKWDKDRKRSRKVTGNVQAVFIQPPFIPQVGDMLRISGKLERPRPALNPGEFDYRCYLAKKNIYTVIQTIGGRNIDRVTSDHMAWWVRWLATMREQIARLIDRLYPPGEAAILKPLVIGLWADVRPEIRNQFMKTGTIHLLAISGLNITMIAGSFYVLFLLLKLDYRIAAILTSGVVMVYMGLAGFGLPVLRAGWMAILVFLGVLLGRRVNFLNMLSLAFFILLLANTRSLWDIGFQLSFLSILSLVLILPCFQCWNSLIFSLAGSAAVLAGTFPLVLYYFNIFSPVSLLANLIGIPVMDAALFSSLFALLFCKIPLLGSLLLHISSFFLWLALAWVKWLSACRWGYWFFVKPSLLQILLYYSTLGGWLASRCWVISWKRWIQTGFLISWVMVTASFFIPYVKNAFQLTVLASGQNQLAHIRFSNQAAWLVNTGRSFPSDQGEWLLCPYLRSQGVQALEGVLWTDFSKRHTGGFQAVLRDFPIHYLLHPELFFLSQKIFSNIPDSFHGKSKTVRPGDGVFYGQEAIEVVAQNRFGMVIQIFSNPWRLLLFSRMDPDFFTFSKETGELPEIHAVILPSLRHTIPLEFYSWIQKVRPLLVILPAPHPELERYLTSVSIPCMNLRHTGAMIFRKKGSFLELESFLNGPLGFYSFR